MKILMLNYEYPPVGGGGSPVTAQLCEHLVRLGHPTDVITMRYKNLPHTETRNGVRIFRTPSYRARPDLCRTHEMASYLLGARRPATALARQNHYDIIHAHFIIPTSPLAWYIRRQTGIPYLVTCHGSDVPGHNPQRFVAMHKLLMPCWKKLVRSTDALVSPSDSLRQKILAICPEAQVRLIHNGIDVGGFRTDRPRHNTILLCSRLLAFKGFQYVIEAVKDLSLDWHVHIIGDGPYRDTLQSLAKDSKTPVTFHGWLDRDSAMFKDLYETSAIFILPSEAENFPTVLLEAMSAGLAIITTTAGGCPEVVGDAALLVAPRNPAEIRQKLLYLVENKSVRDDFSGKGQERIRLFSWSTVAQRHVDTYQELLKNKKNT